MTTQYSMKIVYLPDYSHPYSLSMSTGLFGTASAAPALADGWMLTSLQSSGDNKTAETLASVASVIGATHGAGGSTTAKTSKSTEGFIPANPELPIDAVGRMIEQSNIILKPGLYRFQYGANGSLLGLCAISTFSNHGVTPALGCDDHSPVDANTP